MWDGTASSCPCSNHPKSLGSPSPKPGGLPGAISHPQDFSKGLAQRFGPVATTKEGWLVATPRVKWPANLPGRLLAAIYPAL